MIAEDKPEEKSLILSDTRVVTTQSSSLVKRGLNLIQFDSKIDLVLKIPKVVLNSLGMAFILIPAGEFIMGDSKSALTFNLPCHRVKISQPFLQNGKSFNTFFFQLEFVIAALIPDSTSSRLHIAVDIVLQSKSVIDLVAGQQ